MITFANYADTRTRYIVTVKGLGILYDGYDYDRAASKANWWDERLDTWLQTIKAPSDPMALCAWKLARLSEAVDNAFR